MILKRALSIAAVAAAITMMTSGPAWGMNFGQYAAPAKVYILKVCDEGELIGVYGLQVPPKGKQIDPNGPFRQVLAQLVNRFPPEVVVDRLTAGGMKVELYNAGKC